MLAYKDGTKVRRVSRHGIDHTHRYPVMAAAVAQLTPRTTVLDGETGGVRQATPLTLCLAAPPSARRAGHTARAHRVRRPAGAERPRAAAPLSAHAGTAAGPGATRLLPTAGHSATGCAGSDEEEDCTGRCSPPAAYRQAARPPSPALPQNRQRAVLGVRTNNRSERRCEKNSGAACYR